MPVQCVLSAFLQPNNVLLVRFPWDNIVPFAKTRVLLVPAAAAVAAVAVHASIIMMTKKAFTDWW